MTQESPPPHHPAASLTTKHCIQLIEGCGGKLARVRGPQTMTQESSSPHHPAASLTTKHCIHLIEGCGGKLVRVRGPSDYDPGVNPTPSSGSFFDYETLYTAD